MSDESSREIDAMIREAGGKRTYTVTPAMSDQNRSINDAIIRAAGRLPAGPPREHPAATIGDDDNPFARTAKRLGIPDDLVDIARTAIGPNADELSGAALTSALQKAISDRPGLQVAEPRPMAQLDGGARGGGMEPEPATISDVIRGGIRQQRAARNAWVDLERQSREGLEGRQRGGNGL